MKTIFKVGDYVKVVRDSTWKLEKKYHGTHKIIWIASDFIEDEKNECDMDGFAFIMLEIDKEELKNKKDITHGFLYDTSISQSHFELDLDYYRYQKMKRIIEYGD